MSELKYTVISSENQYDKYCNILEDLIFSGNKNKAVKNEIDLLTLLIEKYDEERRVVRTLDPIELIQSLMADRKMKNIELAKLLDVSEGLVSDMLNKKKGLSKETIRLLSNEFKVSQDAFNQPYVLNVASKINSVKKTRRKVSSHQQLLMSEQEIKYTPKKTIKPKAGTKK